MNERTVIRVIGEAVTPEERIRLEWADELAKAMKFRQVNVKELKLRLDRLGVEVTRQAIESWRAGKSSPRPHVQAAIGTALDLPARSIFPIENAKPVAA